MARPFFSAKPVDVTFFGSAPVQLAETFDIARPAAEVWAELTGDNPLHWCRVIDGITWTSPRPFGEGTTRTVRSLRGANILHERFFRWEEGRRKSFYVVEASGPPFRRFAEDYLVEPNGEDTCRFTWTIAYEPNLVSRLSAPVNNRLLGSLFTDTRKHYAAR